MNERSCSFVSSSCTVNVSWLSSRPVTVGAVARHHAIEAVRRLDVGGRVDERLLELRSRRALRRSASGPDRAASRSPLTR